MSASTTKPYWMPGMTTLVLEQEPRAARVETDDERLTVHLTDGRTLSAPLEWYPRLTFATLEERANYALFRDGYAIYWPDLDEDLHVPGLLAGRRSMESQRSFERWKEEMQRRRKDPNPEPWGKVLPADSSGVEPSAG